MIRGNIVDVAGTKWDLNYKVINVDGAYGIRIEKSSQGLAAKKEIIYEETGGITHSQQEAEAWLHKMAEGRVTPISLHDIVDELVT